MDRSRKNGLVNVHWKTVASKTAADGSEDQFVKKIDGLLAELGSQHDAAGLCEAGEKAVFDSQDPPEVWELPRQKLPSYFSARETAKEPTKSEEPKKMTIIDEKRLQMLGILWRKHRMAFKEESEADALLSLKLAVLTCDGTVVKQEGLSLLRTVIRHHAADGNPLLAYVQENGEASLDVLGHAVHHRLLYTLLKVPQIDERLESMLFRSAYRETLNTCEGHLDTLQQAIDVLERRKPLLKTFLRTAHALGQAMNKDSRAPEAPHGFQLSAFERLLQAKTTKASKYDFLHIVLALMSPEDIQRLSKREDIADLARARALKSYTVYQDCLDL
eukprot:2215284-Amphidinium_carterae.1